MTISMYACRSRVEKQIDESKKQEELKRMEVIVIQQKLQSMASPDASGAPADAMTASA
jgi:hypothetical protein